MRTNEFIRGKLCLIMISFLTSIITILFLYAIQINGRAILIISLLQWGAVLVCLIIEYLRRSAYYHRLEQALDGLDQKYLLTEIINEPLLMDDKILYETLCIVDKSMADNVDRYRVSQSGYKDYIEMWVHEAKTPLTANKPIISNNPSEVTLNLQGEIEKAESFVEQTLFYARSTNPEKDYIIKELPLQECASRIIRKHSRSFIYQKIKIQLGDLELPIYGDSKWLEFILNQIISNVLKYTSKEVGTIHVWITSIDNTVSLHIQDNESGIPSSELGRTFEKGFTGTNGRLNEKAAGMDLHLYKTLCNELYLGIRTESIQGQGTTIVLNFPISKLILLK